MKEKQQCINKGRGEENEKKSWMYTIEGNSERIKDRMCHVWFVSRLA